MIATRSQFEEQLNALRERLLEMGSIVDSMLDRAVRALSEQDASLAIDVITEDDVIDALDLEIEQDCMRLLAQQQPMARDLRLIGTALKVITDLERIGDHSVDIAKVAKKLSEDIFFKPLVDIPNMASKSRLMLQEALGAFVNHDLELVDRVVSEDDEIDRLFHVLRVELHDVMRAEPKLVVQASYLLFVAHYLERIADHAVNIAERVFYVETGNLIQLATSHQPGGQGSVTEK